MVRAGDFNAIGGFDENFRNGGEDIDLCFKIRALGKKIYVANESRVQHHVGLTRGVDSARDARNSRLLFNKWRPKIKNELAIQWARLVQGDANVYKNLLGGRLLPALTQHPLVAGRLIAESIIAREEAGFARVLDEEPEFPNFIVRTRGLHKFEAGLGKQLEGEADIVVSGLQSARDFFVCGHFLEEPKPEFSMELLVNAFQMAGCTTSGGRNFNLGLRNPIILPTVANTFKVSASQPVVITHAIIDGHVVDF
jgi:hypothetical protein